MKRIATRSSWIILFVFLCILVVGFYLRIGSAVGTLVINPLRADAGNYFMYAYNLRYKHTYSQEIANMRDLSSPVTPDSLRSPGYPLFLVPFLDGLSFESFVDRVIIAQVILSLLTILMTYLLCKSFLPHVWALAASLLVAVSPHLIVANSYILTETLFCFTLTVTVWLTGFLRSNPSWWLTLGLGLLMGLASLVRPSLQFFPLLFAFFLVFQFGWRRGGKLTAMALIVFSLSLSPWIIRNMHTLGVSGDKTLMINFLHHGMYPDFTYESVKESRGFPYRYDPRASEISRDIPSVLEEISIRFQKDPMKHLHWFLIGKPVAFWSWNTVQGVGDAFVYPVSRSPYFHAPFFKWSHHLMHALHWPLVILALFGTLMVWLPLSRIGIEDGAVLTARTTSLLLIYYTALHVIGAPFPRYSIPLRPFLYGLAFFPPYLLTFALKGHFRDRVKQSLSS